MEKVILLCQRNKTLDNLIPLDTLSLYILDQVSILILTLKPVPKKKKRKIATRFVKSCLKSGLCPGKCAFITSWKESVIF